MKKFVGMLFRWRKSIITKFMLVSIVILALVAGMVAVNLFSFGQIRALLFSIIEQDLVQITRNAQLGRDLSQVFAETNLLISIFLDRQEYFRITQGKLLDQLELLMTSPLVNKAISLQNVLTQFMTQLQIVFEQCMRINATSEDLYAFDQSVSGQLQNLEDLVTEKMVTEMLEDNQEEIFTLEQLSTLLPGYRDTLSQIALSLVKARQEHLSASEELQETDEHIASLIQLFEVFIANLTVVMTTGEDFHAPGTQLIETANQYRERVQVFHQALTAFQTQVNNLHPIKAQVLVEMGKIDMSIMEKTAQLQQEATEAMDTSEYIVLSLSVVIMGVVILIGSYALILVKPLGALAATAEKMAEGDIFGDIPETRSHDEIGTLSHAFHKLILYIQEMAAAATEIAQGNLSRQIQPKSSRDVLGQAFQNMSVYLTEMATVATSIAEGDLRQEVHPKNEQDILGTAFQQMKSLRQLMGQILDGATQLSTSSEELNQISTQMASAAEQTSRQLHIVLENSRQISENVDAVAVSTEEFATNIHEIARNTDEVAQVTDTAVQIATATNSTIEELEVGSQEINDVISVITAITQQTNLLALNATIEAARAGESGKGFAVVAHEIKELSRETASSAENIIHKLEKIQEGSNNAKTGISRVVTIIQQIRDLSNAIAIAVEQQSGTTQEITHRMQDAARGSLDITRVINEIADSAQHTSAGATDIQHSSGDLAELADHLYHLVQQFKI